MQDINAIIRNFQSNLNVLLKHTIRLKNHTCSLVVIAASWSCRVRTLLSAPASSVCRATTLTLLLPVLAFASSLRSLST